MIERIDTAGVRVERVAAPASLDAVLSAQMVSEGCPNSGESKLNGGLVKTAVVAEPTVPAFGQKPS